MRLANIAELWQSHGVSCIPIVAKNKPAVRWREYQVRIPELGEVSEWWGNGHPYGIALICGAVSGGLEMTEIEGRALSSDALTDIANAADSLGCGEAWDRISRGYTQSSPSGGLHMAYRISDREVPGNEKIAHNETGEVLAETRGEGGYFVGAGSPGSCHPSGEPWLLASGEYGIVPEVTWEERCAIHAALKAALDQPAPVATVLAVPIVATLTSVAPAAPASPVVPAPGATSISPGDHWASVTDWADILEPQGWSLAHSARGGERFWARPGKDAKDGASASTDYNGKPGLYVWSTSAGLETENPLSKLFIYAHYSFNGDMRACAQDLKRRGYGSSALQDSSSEEVSLGAEPGAEAEPAFDLDDAGNSRRLWHAVGQANYRWVHEQNQWYHWNGVIWEKEYSGQLERDFLDVVSAMKRQGRTENNQALIKWAGQSGSLTRIKAAQNLVRSARNATVSMSQLDTPPDLLNLDNGTFNVTTRQLQPHNRYDLMTRKYNAKHDPAATCPKFESFMEQVLPDPEMRKYVQRAVGYSMLGKADRRAFFLIYGPSGTGKSQFLSTMEYICGTYAATAAEGTFRVREGGGPNNDLHGLRGKRFVSTSETAENATFNENLLKRLTGTDQIVSREMYQSNVTWTPECALWVATNHPPRFNSDDDAIWKRAKLVPFTTKFGTDVPEIPNYARDHLYAEADGILNWMLAGLYDFLANGLGEPEGVLEAAAAHRSQSDSVVRFLDDQIADGVLVEMSEGTIRTRELFALYETWSKSSGERGLGPRRFMHRLESSGRAQYSQTSAHSVWKGLVRPGTPGWRGQGIFEDNRDN